MSNALATAETAKLNPPPGWTAVHYSGVHGDVRTIGVWLLRRPIFAPNINLGQEPLGGMSTDKYMAASRLTLIRTIGASALKIWGPQRVCRRTQPGWFDSYILHFGDKTLTVEQTVVFGKAFAFIASYTRLQGTPEDPAARKALETLCVSS